MQCADLYEARASLHLASALNFQSNLGEQIVFAAADDRLIRAALAERLRVVNVEPNLPAGLSATAFAAALLSGRRDGWGGRPAPWVYELDPLGWWSSS